MSGSEGGARRRQPSKSGNGPCARVHWCRAHHLAFGFRGSQLLGLLGGRGGGGQKAERMGQGAHTQPRTEGKMSMGGGANGAGGRGSGAPVNPAGGCRAISSQAHHHSTRQNRRCTTSGPVACQRVPRRRECRPCLHEHVPADGPQEEGYGKGPTRDRPGQGVFARAALEDPAAGRRLFSANLSATQSPPASQASLRVAILEHCQGGAMVWTTPRWCSSGS